MPKNKGFSLIEAAIVLGIVGLVIGGIWVAASAVSHNLKVSRASQGTLVLLKELEKDWKGQANPSGGAMALTPYVISKRMLPSGWSTDGTNIFGPFGEKVHVGYGSIFSGSYTFTLFFEHLTVRQCMALMASFPPAAKRTDIDIAVSFPYDVGGGGCCYDNDFLHICNVVGESDDDFGQPSNGHAAIYVMSRKR